MSTISAGNTTSTAVVIAGDTTGNLAFTTGAGTNTITVPNETGTIITNKTTGTVLQVVQATTSTNTTTTSTSFVTTNLTASITPKFSTSKILVVVSAQGYIAGPNTSGIYTVFRGTVAGTNLGDATWGFVNLFCSGSAVTGSVSIYYLDSPATSSSQTYTYAMRSEGGTTTHINANGQKSTITLMEIAG
jgi:hypothetical protein